MSQMADYLEAAALNYIYRGVAWTPAGTLYAAAATATVADNSTGTAGECAGGGYARVALIKGTAAWNAPGTAGLIDNISTLVFGTATDANWGTITDIYLVDTSTGTGNVYMFGTLTATKVVGSGDIFQISAGDLDITFA